MGVIGLGGGSGEPDRLFRSISTLLDLFTLAVVFIARQPTTPLSLRRSAAGARRVIGDRRKARTAWPGSAIVILAATLNAVPSIPAIGLVLVLSDRLFVAWRASARQPDRQLRRHRRGRA